MRSLRRDVNVDGSLCVMGDVNADAFVAPKRER